MKKPEFWIINISKQDVKLHDLGFYIPAGRSFNLYSNHFHLTYEQLSKSAESGSLYKKRDKVKIRLVQPPKPINTSITEMKIPLWLERSKIRQHLIVQEKVYDELNFTDESFAQEMSEDDI